MSLSKQQYLDVFRASSAYPVYRGVINTITLLLYAIAGLFALSAVVGGLGSMSQSVTTGLGLLVLGVVIAALYYFVARFFKEAAIILADIGDSIVDANPRLHSE